VLRVQSAFENAGITWETPRNMIRILWWKFMVNVGMNRASAVMGALSACFRNHRSHGSHGIIDGGAGSDYFQPRLKKSAAFFESSISRKAAGRPIGWVREWGAFSGKSF
jgi:hypothetical protein